MPDTLEQRARKVLELAETMRTTNQNLLTYWDAAYELRTFCHSHTLIVELAREYLRLRQGFMPPVRPLTAMAANQAGGIPPSTNPNLTTSNYGNGGI